MTQHQAKCVCWCEQVADIFRFPLLVVPIFRKAHFSVVHIQNAASIGDLSSGEAPAAHHFDSLPQRKGVKFNGRAVTSASNSVTCICVPAHLVRP